MAIGGCSINGYWWIFCYWLLVAVLLMAIVAVVLMVIRD
jgi:hypothetical protein